MRAVTVCPFLAVEEERNQSQRRGELKENSGPVELGRDAGGRSGAHALLIRRGNERPDRRRRARDHALELVDERRLEPPSSVRVVVQRIQTELDSVPLERLLPEPVLPVD